MTWSKKFHNYLKYCLAGDSLFKGQVELAVETQHLGKVSFSKKTVPSFTTLCRFIFVWTIQTISDAFWAYYRTLDPLPPQCDI